MVNAKQPFSRQLIKFLLNTLCWLGSFSLVLCMWLGLWIALLQVYPVFNDYVGQRQEVVDYLLRNGGGGLPDFDFLNLAEKRHLLDVWRLFASLEQLFYWVLFSSAVLLVLQQRFAKGGVVLRTGYLGSVSVLVSGLLMLLVGFVPLFILVHTFLFPVGTWVFPDDSILIQLFPLDYFFRFGLVYMGMLSLSFGGLLVWGEIKQGADSGVSEFLRKSRPIG